MKRLDEKIEEIREFDNLIKYVKVEVIGDSWAESYIETVAEAIVEGDLDEDDIYSDDAYYKLEQNLTHEFITHDTYGLGELDDEEFDYVFYNSEHYTEVRSDLGGVLVDLIDDKVAELKG